MKHWHKYSDCWHLCSSHFSLLFEKFLHLDYSPAWGGMNCVQSSETDGNNVWCIEGSPRQGLLLFLNGVSLKQPGIFLNLDNQPNWPNKDKKSLLNRTMTPNKQPRQRRTGLGTALWMSLSGPDLNPIKPLWRAMKLAVHQLSSSSLTELERICREEWQKIPKPQVCRACRVIPMRL